MNILRGTDRQQEDLLPARLEDYVGVNNPVRFLDAFVEKLDLVAAGFRMPKENAEGRGRPAYPVGDLLKLYMYGYLNQVRASRRLERECHRNLEVIWLLRELKPDFKTIADFRKNNAAAFKGAVTEFIGLCRELKLFGGQLLAIDGTKIKASNARDQNWSQSKLAKDRAKTQAKLDEYLEALAQADAQSAETEPPKEVKDLQAKIEKINARKEQIEQRLKSLAQSGEQQMSATDPDSRGMKGNYGHMVGYNVQGAVDAKHHLLVTATVTNSPTDNGLLAAVAQSAKEQLQISRADVTADGGYYKSEDIKRCQEQGMEPHLPEVNNSPSERKGLYGKNDFVYDPVQNVYRCPQGAQLNQRRQTEDKGRLVNNYDNPKACARCPLKAKCTKAKFRTISRWVHEASLERMRAAVAAAPEKLRARKTLIEHCWGSFKWLLPGGFLVRGTVKVQAEVSLAHFGYNLKRVLALVSFQDLMAALENFRPSWAK